MRSRRWKGEGSGVGSLDSRPILSRVWAPNRRSSLGFCKGDFLTWLRFWFLLSGVESGSILTAFGFSAWVWCGRESAIGSRLCGWSGDRCGGGIRAASPARPTTGEVAGPWWASVGLHTGERTSARLGRWRSLGPRPIEEMKIAFYFFKSFLNSKPIWIQIKFEFWRLLLAQ
jgi:hypothetical protein